ncbi:MAG: type II toxin-antitoxin system PemK/MazF family toxin [Actinomycetota bacterium]|nr:type II toxin-antitoxin system PemK/MazF family toxin [Actinomycetota bacterium]
MGWQLRRGEIRLTDFDPSPGSESNKRRPAVIVSNDRANTSASQSGRGVVTVVPMTSQVARVFPLQTCFRRPPPAFRPTQRRRQSRFRSVTVERLGAVLGPVPVVLMAELDDALRLHLNL